LNPKWLKEEDFVKNIKDVWKPYDDHLRESASLQFQQNMKEVKKVAAQWAKDKKQKDERLLKEVEAGLETLYNSEGFGYLTETQKLEVKQLEEKKRNILLEKEKEWRLKSRAIWLQAGDENSKFFHHMQMEEKI
jgi:hypothetical protein